MIVGGALGGATIGALIAFLIIRWWLKWNRQRGGQVGAGVLPIPLYTDESSRPANFAAPPPYPSKRYGFSPQDTRPEVMDHHVVSTLVGATPVTPASTSPGQRPANNGRTEVAHMQQVLPYDPLIHGKAQYIGSNQLNSIASVSSPPSHHVPSSPEGGEYVETVLPAYS